MAVLLPDDADNIVAGQLVLVFALERIRNHDVGNLVRSKSPKVGFALAIWVALLQYLYTNSFMNNEQLARSRSQDRRSRRPCQLQRHMQSPRQN